MAQQRIHEKDVGSGEETPQPSVLDRLVGSVPKQYRDEVTRLAHGIRDRLPPVQIEHRIDALERHVDKRLNEIEAKVEEILQLLQKPSN
jgi:hypothetical protein